MPRFDTRKLDSLTNEEFGQMIRNSEAVRDCSWAIGLARFDGEKFHPVVVFYDSTKKLFHQAFRFPDGEPEIAAFCSRLRAAQNDCSRMNG